MKIFKFANIESIKISENHVFVDGKEIAKSDKDIKIVVEGSIGGNVNIDACNGIEVGGNILGSVETMSANVTCDMIKGDVNTMSGNINSRHIEGNVSTMSGDIK